LGKCWHSLLLCSRFVLKTNKYSRIVDLVVVCSVFLVYGFSRRVGFAYWVSEELWEVGRSAFVVTVGTGCRQVWLILCFVVLELMGVLGTLYLETPWDNNTVILAAGVRTSGSGRWNGRSGHV
jgi:hypothetical protein